MFRYYAKLRPISIGTVPNSFDNKIQNVVNYDDRTEVNGNLVWGYAEYNNRLSDSEIEEYELIEERGVNMRLQADHFYRFNDRGEIHVGQYIGSECGFECCVCGKGSRAKCFNVFYDKDGYETWGYGREHMPKILEESGTELIVDKKGE